VDRDLFHVVILNIIDNSVKYSFDPEDRLKHGLSYKPASIESKENVLITAEEDEESVSITVSSYGVGITEEEKSKIFDRKFRGVHAPDRAKGTGIGLYLAKEITKMHNGTVELVSGTPRHNTVFKITLPKRWVARRPMSALREAPAHSIIREKVI
jgi:signal transduction histidine kinase